MVSTLSNPELAIARESKSPISTFGTPLRDGDGAQAATERARPWLREYPPGVPYEIGPLPHSSLATLLEDSARRFHDRPAFSNLGAVITYAEFDRASRDLAAYLQQGCGLRPGERLAIMMPNLLQYPVTFMAAVRAGLVVVACNPLYTARELHYQLSDSGASAIVAVETAAHVVQDAIPGTRVRTTIVTRVGDMLPPMRRIAVEIAVKRIKHLVPAWRIDGVIAFRSALSRGRDLRLESPALKPEDIALIQYTGGTTGVPKGAMLTHANLMANLEQISAWIGKDLQEGKEIVVTALPLYHVFALTINLLAFIKLGAHNALVTDARNIRSLVNVFRKFRFTVFTGVNTLFRALLRHPGMRHVDTSALKVAVSGAMALQRDVADGWFALTGKPLIAGYGLTETSPLVAANRLDAHAYTGSVGLPVPSTDVSFRDEAGNEVAASEFGELCVRGPQVMKGYWNREAETAAVIDAAGWLRTGDIGYMDERGYIQISDRKKDMIIVSGFKVFPNEVEDVVAGYPGVLEVAAVGTADEKSGQVVTIVVVRSDPKLTAENVIEHCSRELAAYKVPKVVRFSDAPLPKTATGKPLRRRIREQLVNDRELQDARGR